MADANAPTAPPAPDMPAAVPAAVSATTEAVRASAENAKEYLKDNMFKVTFWIIIAAVIACGVALFLYWIITRKLVNKQAYLLPETKMPSLGTELRKVSGTSIPSIGNGQRMSFAFWIYIHDPERFKGAYRHVFHRGVEAVTLDSSPMVFLDKSDTRIHIAFAKKNNTSPATLLDDLPTLVRDRGITIDYVPIQRWVHIGVVVNEETNGGTITAYVDSEMVKVNSNQIQSLNLDVKGDIFLGGSMATDRPGFSGLVGKIQFFNYDLNAKDMYKIYAEGPLDNLLAKVGLPAYGLQSPVYRIG